MRTLSCKPTARIPGMSHPCLQLFPGSSVWSSPPPTHPRQPPVTLPPFPSLGMWNWDYPVAQAGRLPSLLPYLLHPVGTKSCGFHLFSFSQTCSSFWVSLLLLPAPGLAFQQAQLSHREPTTGKPNPRKPGPRACQKVPQALQTPVPYFSPRLYEYSMTALPRSSASDFYI